MMKKIAALLLGLSLSACGLRPVYGDATVGSGAITVTQIDGRLGHRVRQELSRSLAAGLNGIEAGATLTVTVDEKLKRLPLKLDDGVSRSTLNTEADFVLTSASGELILKGKETTTVNFDNADSSYGDIALQSDARERAGRALAKEIFQHLVRKTAKLKTESQPK